MGRYLVDEDLPPDSQRLYGFTKRLGEEVCRNATRQWGDERQRSAVAAFPQSNREWLSDGASH
jgi:nucleoside-diphosphate-sugar epimerase